MGDGCAQGGPDDDLHGLAGALSRGNTRWLRRSAGPANVQNSMHSAPANGTQIAIGGVGRRARRCPFDAGIAPIVDGMASQPCDGRRLVPFVPSPAPSP